jgi:hypothetical protein
LAGSFLGIPGLVVYKIALPFLDGLSKGTYGDLRATVLGLMSHEFASSIVGLIFMFGLLGLWGGFYWGNRRAFRLRSLATIAISIARIEFKLNTLDRAHEPAKLDLQPRNVLQEADTRC